MMQAARVPKGRYAYFVELHIEQVVQMGRVLGVARANTAVGVSPETFLLLLLLTGILLTCHAPIVSCATEYAHWYKCIALTYD
jgi:hypothetical protein